MTLALIAALVGMLAYGVGSVLQGVGAQRAQGPAVVKQPVYVAGLVADGLAWLASLVALGQLPLFAVQSILAGSLAVTVVLARIFLGTRVRRIDASAVGVIVVALVVISLAAGPDVSAPPPTWFTLAMVIGLGLALALILVFYRCSGSVWLAVVSGIAFSGAALCARVLPVQHWQQAAAEPLVWVLLAFGGVGTLAYARSLEGGAIGPATAVLWSVEVVFPGIFGLAVLGDTVRSGWALPASLAVLATVGACIILAGSPAQEITEYQAT